MKEKEILSLTAVQLGKKIKEREVTCREALEAVFAQIRRREPELNCLSRWGYGCTESF